LIFFIIGINGRCESEETLELDYEIVNDTENKADVWVRIPNIHSGQNSICMYYGNNDANNEENQTGVWKDYLGVWHMEETNAQDSGPNNYHGTSSGTTSNVNAKINKGVRFYEEVAANSQIDLSTDLSELEGGNEMTICTWVWLYTLGSGNSDDGMMFSKEMSSPILFWYNYDGSRTYTFNVGGTGTSGNRVNGQNNAALAQTWQYVCGVMNSTSRELYIDGELSNSGNTGAATIPSGSANADFGSWANNNGYDLNGSLDELVILTEAKDITWINQTYQLMNSQDNFVTFGNSEDSKSLVSTTEGDLPFYTNESNPRTINLNAGESEEVIFYVNATASSGTYEFFAFANLTSDEDISNITNKVNVTIVSYDISAPEVSLLYPEEYANLTSLTIPQFNFSVTEDDIDSCELWGNWTGSFHLNQTIISPATDTEINFSGVTVEEQASYIWNVKCNDSSGNQGWDSNRTFSVYSFPHSPTLLNITQDSNDGTGNITSSCRILLCFQ
jgi:hypothetical protein